MTSYAEEYEKARTTRSNAVMSLRSVRNLKIETEARRDDLHPILFGNGTDQGILKVVALYLEQARLTAGRKTSTPDFSGDWSTQYKKNLSLCVTGSGDGADGLYPPELKEGQPTEKAQKDFNVNSKWLNSFSLESTGSPSGTGVRQFCEDLIAAIGTVASSNGNMRGPYLTQELAKAQADKDKGSGYLGKRTENSEVYMQGEGVWYIGQNGIDTPDDYSFKSDLLGKINALLNGFSAYKTCLNDTVNAINNKGAILEEFQIDLPGDISRLNDCLTKVGADTTKIESYRSYFNSISSGTSSNRASINSKLQDLVADCNALISDYNALSDQSSSQLGTPDSGTRKGLVYWVQELVKKPDGPYTVLEGLPQIYEDAVKGLANADKSVKAFSEDVNTWLSVPEIQGVFNQAVLNLDKSIKRWETHVVWKNVLPANKYKLMRKTVTSFADLTNDAWLTAGAETITGLNENGFLLTEKVIEPPTENTFFRVFACDEEGDSPILRADTFNSYSAQSDIVSKSIPFTPLPLLEGCSCIRLTSDTVTLNESDFVVLNNGVLAQVVAVSEQDIKLDLNYGEINSLKKLFGFYFATEL